MAIGAFVVAYVIGSGLVWAMATPLGGVPDEPTHITYATAVARGSLGRMVELDESGFNRLLVVEAPSWTASLSAPPNSRGNPQFVACFAFHVERTADCAAPVDSTRQIVELPTSATRYPPPYYWIVGLPSLAFSGGRAVYLMRVVAVMLSAGLVASGLALASRRRRSWLAVGWVIAFLPTGAHLVGSVNPSGFEIAAAAGLAIGLMGVERDERDPRFTGGLFVFLAMSVAWARPMSVVVLLAVLAASVLVNAEGLRGWLDNRVRRRFFTAGLLLATVSAFLYELIVRLPASSSVVTTGRRWASQNPTSLLESIRTVEGNMLQWLADLVGQFGWVDHRPPMVVVVGWIVLLAGLMVLVAVSVDRRTGPRLAVVVVGAFVIAPLLTIELVTGSTRGYQARYHLPVAIVAILAAVRLGSAVTGAGRGRAVWRWLRLGAILAPLGMLLSVLGSLYRYSLGEIPELSGLWKLMFGPSKHWTPPIPAAIGVMAIGIVIVMIATIGLARTTRPSPESVVSLH